MVMLLMLLLLLLLLLLGARPTGLNHLPLPSLPLPHTTARSLGVACPFAAVARWGRGPLVLHPQAWSIHVHRMHHRPSTLAHQSQARSHTIKL